MSATDSRFQRARRHLELFEEPWKKHHREAMHCRDLEEFIAEGKMLFTYLDGLNRSWRELVFRGCEDFSKEEEQFVRENFERWLVVSDSITADIERNEREFGKVEGADEHRARQAAVRDMLRNWIPPARTKVAALQVHDVSEEEADELRQLLERQKAGKPRIEPLSLRETDASRLR